MNDALTLVAKTIPKESMSEDGVFWWREFRIRHTRYDLYVLEGRYVGRIGDEGPIYAKIEGRLCRLTNPESVWQKLTQEFEIPEDAVWDYMGDSSFNKAESISEVHANAVIRLRRLRLENERRWRAEQRLVAAEKELESWTKIQTHNFYKKHGDKTVEALDKIYNKTKERLRPQYEKLKNERDEAKRQLDNLKGVQNDGRGGEQ